MVNRAPFDHGFPALSVLSRDMTNLNNLVIFEKTEKGIRLPQIPLTYMFKSTVFVFYIFVMKSLDKIGLSCYSQL